MLRPAERFSVNIARNDDYIGPPPRIFRPSPLTLVVLAAILGVGMGGMLPAAWSPEVTGPRVARAPAGDALALIEPAAGPAGGLVVPQAADQGFYAPVLLDGIPVTMRLAPDTPASSLTPLDAQRLTAAAAPADAIQVAQLRLGGVVAGPVALPVADSGLAASVLGADLLDQLGTIRIDGPRLTVAPR